MKQGPFAPGAFCCTPITATTAPSDSLSAAHHFPGSPVIGAPASRRPQRRGQGGPPQFPGQPSDRSTPITPEGPSAPASGSQTPSLAFAVKAAARLPLSPAVRQVGVDDAYSDFAARCRPISRIRPAPHPASRPRTGTSLPGTRTSPRTGLTPAGRPELHVQLRHDHFLSHVMAPELLGARLNPPIIVDDSASWAEPGAIRRTSMW